MPSSPPIDDLLADDSPNDEDPRNSPYGQMPKERRKPIKDYSKIDVTWMALAECKGKPADWFYQRGRGNWQTTYAKALQVCNRCRVRKDCLNYALVTLEPFGLWGGVPPGTREVLLGKRLSNLYPNHVRPPDPGIPKHKLSGVDPE